MTAEEDRRLERHGKSPAPGDESESLLRSALESTADGLLIVDSEGRVTSFNSRFLELWRIPPELAASRDDRRLIEYVLDQLEEPAVFVAKVEELYADPRAESFDELEFKDGRVFERYSRPQLLDGESIGRVWSFRDVTESRLIAEELRQSQKMDAIGRLAGGIAHDFNNILHVIMNSADFLATDPQTSDSARGEVSAISEAARRGRDLVGQLLAFTRKQIVRPEITALNEIILDMEQLLRTTVGEDVRLDLSLKPGLRSVRIDPVQLKQVVLNLALNAREAMPVGGTLAISTSDDSPQVRAEGDLAPNYEVEPRDYVCISVRDTGVGVSPEIADMMFDPFFTTKSRAEATGLGLSTAFGIVKRFDGYISVYSSPGAGTTFQIFLPVDETGLSPARLDADEKGLPGPAKVLLVEDDPAVLRLTNRILSRNGYEVVAASSPREAIVAFEAEPDSFDAVLSDVVLPELSGPELIAKLRELHPRISVVFMSGYTPDVVSRHVPEDDDAIFVQKPFDAPAVLNALSSVITTR